MFARSGFETKPAPSGLSTSRISLMRSVYVLHCFQKKAQETSKKDLDLAKRRYRALTEDLANEC